MIDSAYGPFASPRKFTKNLFFFRDWIWYNTINYYGQEGFA